MSDSKLADIAAEESVFRATRPLRIYIELPNGDFIPGTTKDMQVEQDPLNNVYHIGLTAIIDVTQRGRPPEGFRNRVRSGVRRARAGMTAGPIHVPTPEELARKVAKRQAEKEEKERKEETVKRFAALDLED